MIHLLYFILFSFFISIMFAVLSEGGAREKVVFALKTFAKFTGISLIIAWAFYLFFS